MLGYDPAWLDRALEIYNQTELKRTDRGRVHRAFQKSFAVVSCCFEERLVGVGRMISDGEMYSGIFDVVVDPNHQKQGIGKRIVETLIAQAPDTCIHLTSTFGNEAFYYKLGFRKHRTGMALYPERLKGSRYLDEGWKPD